MLLLYSAIICSGCPLEESGSLDGMYKTLVGGIAAVLEITVGVFFFCVLGRGVVCEMTGCSRIRSSLAQVRG